MVRLLGWGDEAGTPRGFVPDLEVLEGRAALSLAGKVKIDFALVLAPDVPVQQSTVSPGVSQLAAPDGESGTTGTVQVDGGSGLFDPISVQGGGIDLDHVSKASPILF